MWSRHGVGIEYLSALLITVKLTLRYPIVHRRVALDDFSRIMQDTRCLVPISHLLNVLALISAAISIGLWLALMHQLTVVTVAGDRSVRRWTRVRSHIFPL